MCIDDPEKKEERRKKRNQSGWNWSGENGRVGGGGGVISESRERCRVNLVPPRCAKRPLVKRVTRLAREYRSTGGLFLSRSREFHGFSARAVPEDEKTRVDVGWRVPVTRFQLAKKLDEKKLLSLKTKTSLKSEKRWNFCGDQRGLPQFRPAIGLIQPED